MLRLYQKLILEHNNKRLFVLCQRKENLEVYNDAYGMLEMIDEEHAKNVYTDAKCNISQLKS